MRRLALALLSPLIASCSLMGGEESGWIERPLAEAPPQRELLAYCQQAMGQAGYPRARVEESRGAVESDWRLELQPFASAGRRYRATIEVDGAAGGAATLRARVETEKNGEQGRPMDPVLAKWETMPADPDRARILLQHVVSLLVTSGAGSGR